MKKFKIKKKFKKKIKRDTWPSNNTDDTQRLSNIKIVEVPERINPKKGNRTNTENYNSLKLSWNQEIWNYTLREHILYLRIVT